MTELKEPSDSHKHARGSSGMTGTPATATSKAVDSLLELSREIWDSLSGAQAYLLNTFKPYDPDNLSAGGGWSQFLDEVVKAPSVTGTTHGIFSLIASGEPQDSEIIVLGKRLIVNNARPDGGWTKPDLFNYCSLTRISSLAIRALLDAGEPFSSPLVSASIEWLIKAQNEDGGWGNLAKDKKSDVTSTSFALQALARIPGLHAEGREAITSGRTWLLKVKNQDSSWGYRAGDKGTVAQTSEAIEGLLASGVDHLALSSTHEWLIRNIHEDAQFIERYLIEDPLFDPPRSIIWTQVSIERGLIALLRLGSSITAPEVINSVRKILDRQVNHTYWRAEAFTDSQPVWALKEAVISLRLYYDHLKRDQAAIVLSEELSNLKSEVDFLRSHITRLETQINRLSAKARLFRFISFMKKPIPLLVLLNALLVAFYFLLINQLASPQHAENLLGVLAIVSVFLALYEIIKSRRK